MTTSRLFGTFSMLLLALAGCTTTVVEESLRPTDVALTGGDSTLCSEMCERTATCDPDTDAETCRNRCDNKYDSLLSKFSNEYTGKLMSCVKEASCKDVLNDRGISDCQKEVGVRITPSDQAVEFCDGYADAATKCDADLDKAECYDTMKVFGGGAIANASKCLDKSCGDIEECVSAALGGISDSGIAPSPALGGNTVGGGEGGTCSPKMFTKASSCHACMGSSCCAEDNACANDQRCGNFLGCYSECSTESCRSSCINAYPRGAELFVDLAKCMDSSCSSSCG